MICVKCHNCGADVQPGHVCLVCGAYPRPRRRIEEGPFETRTVAMHCTCEGPFGCEVHDPNLDGLVSIEGLPTDLVLAVVLLAKEVTAKRQQCNGEVYAVECGLFDELDQALRELAQARRAHEGHR